MPASVSLLGFASDLVIVITKTEEGLMDITNTALVQTFQYMRGHKLDSAREKTEAALLITKRKIAEIKFRIQETAVVPKCSVVLRCMACHKAHLLGTRQQGSSKGRKTAAVYQSS